ncbi:MAG: hypothetical protein HQ515_03230 [Phycisphaeraceae bacterium]|nr:hypothetical protein [Phycisphaeraceae bacterium]
MGRTILIIFVFVSLVVLPQVWAQDDPVPSDAPSFEIKYKLILERNIFSRERQVYREVLKVERNEPPPPPLEASFVLVGISLQGDMAVAFIEDTSLGQVDQYGVNSQIAMGKIQAMTLDSLQYVVNTDVNDVNALTVADVKVGQSLLGEAASGNPGGSGRSRRGDDRMGRDSGQAGGPSESAPSQGSDADDMSDEDMDAVLKRMMEKRKSE